MSGVVVKGKFQAALWLSVPLNTPPRVTGAVIRGVCWLFARLETGERRYRRFPSSTLLYAGVMFPMGGCSRQFGTFPLLGIK